MKTSLKAGFAQIFSCCPKNLSCPKFGGAAVPLAPPARTPMTSSIVFFFLTLLHRVSRQFQIGSDFSWHCLIVCVTIWLLLKRTKRRHRRCGWVTDSFCLEHIDRKVRFRHTKKAKKKSKIKLASSRYIVFSNQAEINQVKTDRTKISTQPDTSLCMQ